MKQIIIIEDEESIADTIIHSIEREGYFATWCSRGTEGLEKIKSGSYSLVILDIGLPDSNGFELCKAIRRFSSIPIIFLTARNDEVDTIVGLEIGADDYITKPFSPRELGARIKSVLRRSSKVVATEPLFSLSIDDEKMQAVYCGLRLELTRYEFKLLALLAKHPGRVFSRDMLMQSIWGDDSQSLDRTVDAHIKSLRAKCRAAKGAPDPIVTHRGVGYALRDEL